VGRLFAHAGEVELLHRSMGFAAFGSVALTPLLIVVAALEPRGGRGFSQWLIEGMGLEGRPAEQVREVFSAPRIVITTTSVWGAVLLAVFGLSFAGSVQSTYTRIWELSVGPWHKLWRQALWLAGLTVYLYADANSVLILPSGTWTTSVRVVLILLLGVVFFWWGQNVLLGGQVPALHLLPGAIATMIGLVGLRWFSWLVFSPLVASNAITYGPVGTVLIVVSWLVGVGYVFFGGTLLGRHVSDWFQRRAER
jgi:membrane protein